MILVIDGTGSAEQLRTLSDPLVGHCKRNYYIQVTPYSSSIFLTPLDSQNGWTRPVQAVQIPPTVPGEAVPEDHGAAAGEGHGTNLGEGRAAAQ